MATTTIIHKITNALAKIGKANGTALVEPDYTGTDKSNSARVKWLGEWVILAEYMVAKTMASISSKREEVAKAAVQTAFADEIKKITIGNSETVTRGNVSILFNRRNAPRRINEQTVINVLTAAPYNWKLEDITDLLLKINVSSPNGALWITPSTTME